MTERIDLKDRKILYELDLNSRQTNKQIARKVGLSEQVVGNRIKRLMDRGVIEYFYVKTNPALLGFMHIKIYLRLHNITKQKESEFIKELNHANSIYWLSSLRGKYDLVTSIYAKNMYDFSRKYEELFGEWGEYILDRNVILLEKAYTYSKIYLAPKQQPHAFLYSEGKEEPIQLNKLDFNLLKILNKGGRKPFVDIAHELKVSPDTIRYRINNLQNKKVITGFGVKIDFNKLGNNYYILFFKLQNMDSQKYNKLETLSRLNKNIIIYIKTIGDHDLELEVETTNKEELDEIIKILRDNFVAEITDYEILEVTREHRMTYFPF
jgi:DNA-binding Lrp family transcriptional regulator